MNMNSWIIIIDQRRAGGMLDADRKLGGKLTAAVVGPRELADSIAELAFDQVICFEAAEGIPPEAYAGQLALAAKSASPRLILASDAPASRVLLGSAAAMLNASLIGAVRALASDGDFILASRSIAEGKVVEDIEVGGTLAGIFDGDDVEVLAAGPIPVELMPLKAPGAALRLL
jgi:electron transfer flavoprotein alpha subunit